MRSSWHNLVLDFYLNLGLKLKAALKNPWTYVFIGFYLVLILIIPRTGFPGDDLFWKDWTQRVYREGVVALYNDPIVNYLPGFIYVLKVLGLILAQVGDLGNPYLAIKALTLLCDFGMAVIAYKFLKKFRLPLARVLFILLNFALLYDTIIWGQVDSIPTFFALLAIWMAMNSRPHLSVIALLLALNFKMQAIVFVPVVILLLAGCFAGKKAVAMKISRVVLTAALTQSLLLLPFLLTGQLNKLINVINNAVGYFPYVSVNAYNFWIFSGGTQNNWKVDTEIYSGTTNFHQAGLLMFIIAMVLVMIPLLGLLIRKFRGHKVDWLQPGPASLIILTAGLAATVFFYFNTQMHERYLYPALIFFGIYAVIRNHYWSYLLISFGFLLNIDSVMQWLPWNSSTFLRDPLISAALITIALGWGLIQLYQEWNNLLPGIKSHATSRLAPQEV